MVGRQKESQQQQIDVVVMAVAAVEEDSLIAPTRSHHGRVVVPSSIATALTEEDVQSEDGQAVAVHLAVAAVVVDFIVPIRSYRVQVLKPSSIT